MLDFNAVVPELAVTDWRNSLAFYCDVLGFEMVYSRSDEGFAFLRHGEAQLMIDQIGIGRTFGEAAALVAGALGRGINLQIRVATLDPLLEGLSRAGVSLHVDCEERIYTIAGQDVMQRQFVVADPDGYLLRFCEMVRVVPATVPWPSHCCEEPPALLAVAAVRLSCTSEALGRGLGHWPYSLYCVTRCFRDLPCSLAACS